METYSYQTYGNGLAVKITRDGTGYSAFLQGDDASHLLDQIDQIDRVDCKNSAQIEQMILSEYDGVMDYNEDDDPQYYVAGEDDNGFFDDLWEDEIDADRT